MESLKEVLMRRDSLTSEEEDSLIKEMKDRVLAGEDPEEVLHDDAGLEPDYIFDLLGF